MTRLTFDVCASSFAANMDYQQKYPQVANAAIQVFYVDDGLVGADSVDSSICLQEELQCLFALGGFHLRKWEGQRQDRGAEYCLTSA